MRIRTGALSDQALLLPVAILLLLPGLGWPAQAMAAGLGTLMVLAAAALLLVFRFSTRAATSPRPGNQWWQSPTLAGSLLMGWALVCWDRSGLHGARAHSLALAELLRLGCGVAIYAAVSRLFRDRRALRQVQICLLTAGVVVAIAGLATGGTGQGGTAAAAMGNPQLLATFLVMLLPFAGACCVAGPPGPRRLLGWVALLFLIAALVATRSRAGWIAGGVGTGIALLPGIAAAVRSRQRHRPAHWLAPALGLAAAALVAITAWGAFPSLGKRASGLLSPSGDASIRWRGHVWQAGVDLVRRHPIFGCGPGAFPLVAGKFDSGLSLLDPPGRPRLRIESEGRVVGAVLPQPEQVEREGASLSSLAHNEYLQSAAELGLPGLAAYLIMLLLFFRRCLRDLPRLRSHTRRAMLTGAAAGLAAFCLDGAFSPSGRFIEVSTLFWLLLGLGDAACASTGSTGRRVVVRRRPASGASPWAVPGWAVACMALLVITATTAQAGSMPEGPTRCYLEISPTPRLRFSCVTPGVPAQKQITITNRGTVDEEVGVLARGRGFSGGGTATIPAGRTFIYTMEFFTSKVGSFHGTAEVHCFGQRGWGIHSIPMDAHTTHATIEFRPRAVVSFGPVPILTTVVGTINICNVGCPGSTLTGSARVSLWGAGPIFGPPLSASFALPAGGCTPITVTFTPILKIRYSTDLVVTYTERPGGTTVTTAAHLSGSGI